MTEEQLIKAENLNNKIKRCSENLKMGRDLAFISIGPTSGNLHICEEIYKISPELQAELKKVIQKCVDQWQKEFDEL